MFGTSCASWSYDASVQAVEGIIQERCKGDPGRVGNKQYGRRSVLTPLHPDEAYDDGQKGQDNCEGERYVMQRKKNWRPESSRSSGPARAALAELSFPPEDRSASPRLRSHIEDRPGRRETQLGGLKVGFCNRHTMRPAGWGADRSANANNYKDEKSETSVSLCHASAWLRRS